MSDLPSREDTLVAISRWVGREPEVAYDLHPDLRVILNAARGWSSGRLVDRETIDPDRVRAAINRHVHSASEFYDGGAWIEAWADIEAAWADIEAAWGEEI